ncbi:MAG: hemerythrin domain-containing protein [Pyrinomonadaceae bacterium]|nr:hemerythrin domain-containing protein [Pyrinomonadaceae bacterium]
MNSILTADHNELDGLLEEVFKALGNHDQPEIYKTLDIFWARLAMHIRAEHLHLFKAILQMEDKIEPGVRDSVKSTIAKLRVDHDFFVRELAAAIKIVRDLIFFNQDPEEKLPLVRIKVRAIVELLRTHNDTEENEIYPMAEALVDESDHSEMNDLIRSELNKLPPRFDGDRSGRTNLAISILLEGRS